MFISRERLCVHNLPPRMTDQQLAKLFKKNSSKDAKVIEVALVYSTLEDMRKRITILYLLGSYYA